jgi:hypothetical protein
MDKVQKTAFTNYELYDGINIKVTSLIQVKGRLNQV